MLLESQSDVLNTTLPLLTPERERDDLAAWLDEKEEEARSVAHLETLLSRRGVAREDFEI